jgi:hypothetical protein
MDILSLVALTAWLAQCLDAPDGRGFEHAEDRLSVIRLHFKQKNYDEVIRLASVFQHESDGEVLRCECLEMLARACKRRDRWEEMEAAWETLIALAPGHPVACVELAKHCEHRARDLERAAMLCAAALDYIDERIARGRSPGLSFAEIDAIRSRHERILKKIDRARPLGTDLDFD